MVRKGKFQFLSIDKMPKKMVYFLFSKHKAYLHFIFKTTHVLTLSYSKAPMSKINVHSVPNAIAATRTPDCHWHAMLEHGRQNGDKKTISNFKSKTAVVGSAMIHATRVLGVTVVVDGPSPVFLGKKFFHFPVALLGANTELKILFRNRIPVLILNFSKLP